MAKSETSSLTLHYHPYSFYSQKALMCLVEKQLPFKRKIVNLPGNECASPSFLKINPIGKVPVLQDGAAYIPDSAEIAKYLDEKFGGSVLQPDQKTDFGGRVKHFNELYDSVRVDLITYGAAVHPDVVHEVKLPWFVAQKMKAMMEDRKPVKHLEKMLKKHSDLAELYTKKIAMAEEFCSGAVNKSRVVAERKKVRDILHETEKELIKTANENPDQESWLCGPSFTIADINLTILLGRLIFTGYSGALFENGVLPKVEEYYKRVQKRKSFQEVKSSVTVMESLKFMMPKWIPVVGVTCVALLGGGVAYYFLKKK